MSDPGIGTYVRYWLHYNNLTSALYKQFCSSKKVQDEYAAHVINTLQQKGMEKAIIQIGDGQISVVERRQANQLSFTTLQDLLHKYYAKKGGKNETMEIMTFIKANRGYNVTKSLKKSGIPPAQQITSGS